MRAELLSAACWHQLGTECPKCGYVTVPARFYWYEGGVKLAKERTHAEAVSAFRAWGGQGVDNPPTVDIYSRQGGHAVDICIDCLERKKAPGKARCWGCIKARTRSK